MEKNIYEIKNLCKTFRAKSGGTVALGGVDLTVGRGDILGVIGFSGAGKSTLVRCLNLLERPDSGTVLFDGRDLAALKARELRRVRQRIGMIFQGFNLLSRRTALGNVLFPLETAGVPRAAAGAKAAALLAQVGLADKLNAYPAELSGGQQQRVAIARALATDPEVLLCDEATSALDSETAASVLALLARINAERGITLVVVTHQLEVVSRICRRVAVLENGGVRETGDASAVLGAPTCEATRRLLGRGEAV